MKTTLLPLLLPVLLLSIGCQKPEPLRISCSNDMLPVMTVLGREFQKHFGVPIITTTDDPNEFAAGKSISYDFVVSDDLELIESLAENGTISKMTDIGYAMPVMVLRRDDHLPVLKLADLAALDRPLRMTIASSGGTLPRIVTTRFEQAGIPLQGDEAKIQLLPFLLREIRSDGTQQQTTPDIMLQQLRGRETDIVVFWDFVAAEALAKQDDANAFVTVAWPQEASDMITIPLGLAKDCSNFTVCEVFIDFVKSRRGSELLQSCFLHPSDDLVGRY